PPPPLRPTRGAPRPAPTCGARRRVPRPVRCVTRPPARSSKRSLAPRSSACSIGRATAPPIFPDEAGWNLGPPPAFSHHKASTGGNNGTRPFAVADRHSDSDHYLGVAARRLEPLGRDLR